MTSSGGGGEPTALPSPGYAAVTRDAREVLSVWTAPDQAQDDLRRSFLAHLDAHPQDAMAKSGPPAHLTASALVLDDSHERVLLTLHLKARLWLQFGGHVEATDTTVRGAATREAREESGLGDLTLHPGLIHLDQHRLGGGFARCTDHLDLRYAGVVPADAAYAVSEESEDVRWWPVDGLPADSREEIEPLVRAARRVLG